MPNLFSVENKVVLVSGGSRGIGRAIAEAFRDQGARVVVTARNETALKATAMEYTVCDVADSAQINRTAEQVAERFGAIDVLFNVAGINFRHATGTFPEDKLEEILRFLPSTYAAVTAWRLRAAPSWSGSEPARSLTSPACTP
jgi:NAD(P)-dependent dehydrogenase (short-subunit alcohol dehydrogenase family)